MSEATSRRLLVIVVGGMYEQMGASEASAEKGLLE